MNGENYIKIDQMIPIKIFLANKTNFLNFFEQPNNESAFYFCIFIFNF